MNLKSLRFRRKWLIGFLNVLLELNDWYINEVSLNHRKKIVVNSNILISQKSFAEGTYFISLNFGGYEHVFANRTDSVIFHADHYRLPLLLTILLFANETIQVIFVRVNSSNFRFRSNVKSIFEKVFFSRGLGFGCSLFIGIKCFFFGMFILMNRPNALISHLCVSRL